MSKILHVGMGNSPAISRELAKLGPYRFIDWTGYMELGVGAKDLLQRDIIKNSEQCCAHARFGFFTQLLTPLAN